MNEIFKNLIDNIHIPIWIKDLDLHYIFVNNKYAEINNKKMVDFIGKRNEDIFNSETSKRYNRSSKEVIKTLEPRTTKEFIDNVYKECRIVPIINDHGVLTSIAGIIGLLTEADKLIEIDKELKKQRNLTNQILDMLPGATFYKDTDSKYVYANKACRDFYLARGVDSIIGKTDSEINQDKKLAQKFFQDDQKIITTKTTLYNEAVFQYPDGENEYREVVKMPVLDSMGNVIGIVGRATDITGEKKVQERLEYLSYTDILTGANNRTRFEERAQEYSKEGYLPLGIIMGDVNGLKLVNDTFGHQDGDKLLIELVNVFKLVCKDIGEIFRIGGDEFVILIPNTSPEFCETIIKRIVSECKKYNSELFKLSVALGSAIKRTVAKDLYETLKEAEDKVYRQKLLQKKSIKIAILNSLKMGLGIKRLENKEHTQRVIFNAVKMGQKLDLEMSAIDELRIAADLHDIGKIGIDQELLLKPGKLTVKEYEVMKTHSEKGYHIIKASSELQNVALGVLYHHERWDGTGYPMGLKGKEIPLFARIIALADAYDVMTHERSYKKSINHEEAIDEIKRCSGTQFDPKIVEVFLACTQIHPDQKIVETRW
ncbi:MAG: HD domain-containing phosphohydrolase [Acetobacterium sp.]